MEQLTEGNSSFEPLRPNSEPLSVQRVIMPLFMEDGEDFVSIGTGFMISNNGLMMTASHVVHLALEKASHVLKDGHWTDQSGLYALYTSAERHGEDGEKFVGGLWPIDYVWMNKETDIACCWLRVQEREGKRTTFKFLKLSPGLPVVGQSVTGFGYSGLSKKVEVRDGRTCMPYDLKAHFTQGRVIEIHEMGRDKGLLPFPCFSTDMRIDAGMSGGPVYNDKSNVCGVMGTSWGYVSLLWIAMGLRIWIASNTGSETMPKPLLSLIHEGYLASDGSEKDIKLDVSETGEVGVSLTRPSEA